MSDSQALAGSPSEVAGGSPVVLELKNVTKRFGALTALESISFRLHRGETLALLGDNGAGKSTLVKCLSGVYHFDEGEVQLEGEPVSIRSPHEAQEHGIETVFQDLALFDNLNADANIFIGREETGIGSFDRAGFLRKKVMRRKAKEAVESMKLAYKKLDMPVSLLSGGQRQILAISRAKLFADKFIILDEPTAALGLRESEAVLDFIKELPGLPMSTILISHNLDHVVRVADRAVVLRQGQMVGELTANEENRERLVSMIVGN